MWCCSFPAFLIASLFQSDLAEGGALGCSLFAEALQFGLACYNLTLQPRSLARRLSLRRRQAGHKLRTLLAGKEGEEWRRGGDGGGTVSCASGQQVKVRAVSTHAAGERTPVQRTRAGGEGGGEWSGRCAEERPWCTGH